LGRSPCISFWRSPKRLKKTMLKRNIGLTFL
jgi:hypothetical protein